MNISSELFTEYSSVALIGFATDGPTNTLLYMDNSYNTDAVLGSGSQLANAVYEAYNAGAKSVFAVRINGTSASVTIQDMLKISNINAGTKYNGKPVTIGSGYINIDSNAYKLSDYKDINELAIQINSDREFNIHDYKAEVLENGLITSLIDISTTISGALDESTLSEDEIYSRLEDIYYTLNNYPVNIIVPLCAKYDSDMEFDMQLIDFCKEKFNSGELAIGVMAVKDPVYYEGLSNEQAVQNQVDKLRAINKDYGIDGRFISVVVSAGKYRNNLFYSSNCAASYAGLISMSPFVTTTNKVIDGISALDMEYTDSQMNDLTNFVFIQDTVRIGLAVRYGSTMYSGFTVETSNIINHINCIIQEENYDINEVMIQNVAAAVLQKKIEKALKQLIDSREIQSVEVTVSGLDRTDSYATIAVSFVKYNEVRLITAEVGVHYGV